MWCCCCLQSLTLQFGRLCSGLMTYLKYYNSLLMHHYDLYSIALWTDLLSTPRNNDQLHFLNINTELKWSKAPLNPPADSPVLIQSGLTTLAMAKMSAARKRHPEITVSLSMSVRAGGGQSVFVPLSQPSCFKGKRDIQKKVPHAPSSPRPSLRWWGRSDSRLVRTWCFNRR